MEQSEELNSERKKKPETVYGKTGSGNGEVSVAMNNRQLPKGNRQ